MSISLILKKFFSLKKKVLTSKNGSIENIYDNKSSQGQMFLQRERERNWERELC